MKSRKRISAVLLAVIMIFSIAGASMAADMPAAAETPAATDTFQETLISAETPSASPSASPDPSVTPAPSSAQAAQSEALDTAVMALDEKTGIDALPLTTEGDEILISSPDDLLAVMNDPAYWDKQLKVTAPIDMSGVTAAQPMGNSSTPFSGTFDGNGQTISNLTITSSGNYVGLFGKLTGTAENVTLADSDISGDQYVGGIIGYHAGTVQGCAVKNTAVSSACTQTMGYIGGFAGYSKGDITRCFVDQGSVSQTAAGKGKGVGGFVGYCYSPGKIGECYTTAAVVSESEQAGGFVGFGYSGTMENCFSAGGVTGAKYVGGFVGSEDSAKYTNCYTVASVVSTGTNNYFGKFFGDGFFMSSYVSKAFYLSTASVSGNGTEKSQGSYLLAKTGDELKALAGTLGSAWTQDDGKNNGYPYLVNVQAPEGSGEPSGPAELAQPSGLAWTDATASWNAVTGAESYTVKLYKNTDTLVDTYANITGTSKDFKAVITETGDYFFTVQAVAPEASADYITGKESSRSAAYQFVKKDDQEFILISTPDELLALAKTNADLTKNYKLANDIDMAGQAGKVIGKYNNGASGEKVFTGVFDGGGHAIKNLSIAGEALFGYVGTDGIIRNLTLENAAIEDTVSSSSHYPAALVSNNKGTVEKCYSVGSTVVSKFNTRTGGLIGNNEGLVRQCGVSGGSVTYQGTGTMTGGLVGRIAASGSVSESFSSASVSGYKWVGGFAGGVEKGTVTDCYAMGLVTGKNELGGFAGMLADPSTLTNVYAANDVNASVGTGGALVGGKGFSFDSVGSVVNGYYNSGKLRPDTQAVTVAATAKTASEMKTAAFASLLGGAWRVDAGADGRIVNNGYPYLVNAAPAANAPVAEEISVQILVANWDNVSYRFIKSEQPFTVKAAGEDITAEQVMSAAQAAGQMTYAAEQSSTGTFIKTINDKTLEAPDGWMFTINDKQSPVGVSAAQIKSGDKILWYEGTTANGYKAPTWAEMTAPVPLQYETISTREQLVALMNSTNQAADWAKNYKLTANIDLSGVTALPIGSETVPFSGIFDGAGYKIKNLKIEKSVGSQNIGLFGVIEGASILNLTVENASVTGGSRIGVLVGNARADIASEKANLIGNCHVSGKLNALGTVYIKQTDAGGLVGLNDGGSKDGKSAFSAIDNCSSSVEVTASTGGADNTESGHVGGLVGWNKGNILQCEATGNVFGGNSTGGFVGGNYGYANIYKSHATGNVVGGYTTGGFAGSIGMGTSAERCYATGNVVAIEDGYGYYFGGFAGSVSGMLKECVSTGTLTPGWSYNGGFAGAFDGTVWSYNDDLLTLRECYGNSETSLGTKIKGLGNYIGGTHEATDAAAARTALTKEQAAAKLTEMLAAQAKEEADKTALRQEAAKYESYVTIPNTVEENANVTPLVAKLKDGATPDENIEVLCREAGENSYVTSAGQPLGQYKLARKNTSFGAVEEQVMLLFTQGGETVAQPVTVQLMGAKSNASASDLMSTIAKDYTNLPYEDSTSDWAAFDLAVYAGADQAFATRAAKVNFIKESIAHLRTNNATDYERLIMTMSALGMDARQYVDVLAQLPVARLNTVNAQAFALLAYDSGNYTLPSGAENTREKAIEYLLANKNADGGWSYMPGESEASMTAIVLSALAPYQDRAGVASAVTSGLDYLAAAQSANGGYVYYGAENSNDAAMVVIALTSLGIDANTDGRFVKNGNSVYQNLMSFVTQDNRFGYTDNAAADALATEQGFRALIAYSRLSASGYNIYRVGGSLEEWMKPVRDTDNSTGVTIDTDTTVVPKGTILKTEKVESGAGFELTQKTIGKDSAKFVLFEISLSDPNGNPVQPNGKVRIGIPIPDGFDKTRLVVYRIDADGSRVEYTVTVEGNMAYFETDHFSLYALAEKAQSTGAAENTGTTSKTSAAKTGDTREIGGYVVLLFAAAAAACITLALNRRRRREQ